MGRTARRLRVHNKTISHEYIVMLPNHEIFVYLYTRFIHDLYVCARAPIKYVLVYVNHII